jgi:hypothetical protein
MFAGAALSHYFSRVSSSSNGTNSRATGASASTGKAFGDGGGGTSTSKGKAPTNAAGACLPKMHASAAKPAHTQVPSHLVNISIAAKACGSLS